MSREGGITHQPVHLPNEDPSDTDTVSQGQACHELAGSVDLGTVMLDPVENDKDIDVRLAVLSSLRAYDP